MTARDLLLQLDPWLLARSRRVAAELPSVRAEDIYQEAVEEFLRDLGRWLQQDATVSVVAQARTLMAYCLGHARTRAIRELKKRHEVDREHGDDPLETVADPTPIADRLDADSVLARVRAATTPPCALCVLSLRLPGLVVVPDAERAKAWKKGGSNAVPRSVPEAWEIFDGGRGRVTLVADDIAWKEFVGIAWYTEGAVGELTGEVRRGAAAKVERYANRGIEDLRALLLSPGDDA